MKEVVRFRVCVLGLGLGFKSKKIVVRVKGHVRVNMQVINRPVTQIINKQVST